MLPAVRQYIETIAGFTVSALFIQALIGERMRQSVSFILGLMLLLIICRPLSSILNVGLDFPIGYKAMESTDVGPLRKQLIANGIKSELEQELVRRTGAERAEVELNDDNSVNAVKLYNAENAAAETAALLCGTNNVEICEE